MRSQARNAGSLAHSATLVLEAHDREGSSKETFLGKDEGMTLVMNTVVFHSF